MSQSSLWVMTPEFYGTTCNEYHNSWWFSPVVWDVLLDKYMHEEIQTPYGPKKSLIGLFGADLHSRLNDKMNNSYNFSDRVCWELSNQQVFFTKDKQRVADAVRKFCSENTAYHISEIEQTSVLTFDHIIERFNQIADDIEALDENAHPYFIFKNTTVDDGVVYWFSRWDDENDDSVPTSLREADQSFTEFVMIDGDTIKGFVGNLDYFKKMKDKES